MTYTWLAVVGVALAAALDLLLLRTALLTRKAFWTAYAIVFAFQLLTNGILTGQRLVVYRADEIIGWRVAYAPVEDLLFGFSLVVQSMAWWVWWGRRARHARTTAGTPTDARRSSPTRARRSRTR